MRFDVCSLPKTLSDVFLTAHDNRKEQRKTTKPVACRLCPKTFAFNKDRKRHYVVSHKDYAVSEGLSVELIPCPTPGCERTYTRSDNVTRHLKTSGCGKQ